MNTFVKIEWQHTGTISGVYYANDFMQHIFLDVYVSASDYELQSQYSKNNQVLEARWLKKRASLNLGLIPAPVVDTMNALSIHSNVGMYDRDGFYWPMTNIECETTWQDDCYATVVLKFDYMNIFNDMTCCNNMTITP